MNWQLPADARRRSWQVVTDCRLYPPLAVYLIILNKNWPEAIVGCRVFIILALNFLLTTCTTTPAMSSATSGEAAGHSSVELLSYRIRSDFDAPLNADSGWAAAEGRSARLHFDEPFRLRIQVRASLTPPEGEILSLQYRWQRGPWTPVGVADFPYPQFATPVLSVVSADAYPNGEETQLLLGEPGRDGEEGAGLNAVASTPVWRSENDLMEWEWPLVVRRFADGPVFAENGSQFELRVIDGSGRPLAGQTPLSLEMSARGGHLGGTFVETPGRLGPYQSTAGHLYFFMEPTETDNRFMAVRSTDYGRNWREAAGASRPTADDLEGVASARTGSVIHLLHQVSRAVYYHAFRMGEPGGEPDSWLVDSEIIARPGEPATQYADLAARRDGSLVAVYSGPQRIFLQVRTPEGQWGQPREIDPQAGPELSGPVLASGPDDIVTLAYTAKDGRGFIRHLYPNDSLGSRLLLSEALGSTDAENGAILPLVVFPESGTTAVIYREQDGLLFERLFSRQGELGDPVRISDLRVVTNAVDSEQVGADLVRHGSTLHLLFIEADSRDIFHARSDAPGIWSAPQPVIEGVQASWLRGSVHSNASGKPVYGFVYDAGSRGGSGLNRYHALPLKFVSP